MNNRGARQMKIYLKYQHDAQASGSFHAQGLTHLRVVLVSSHLPIA